MTQYLLNDYGFFYAGYYLNGNPICLTSSNVNVEYSLKPCTHAIAAQDIVEPFLYILSNIVQLSQQAIFFIFEAGADVNAIDIDSLTVLDYAESSGMGDPPRIFIS